MYLEISSEARGQRAHCVHLRASFGVYAHVCICTRLCIHSHIFKYLNVHMWWRVYARINPLWSSCSDCSLARLLGLAPKVAQTSSEQTKYQAHMPISSVPMSHPQHAHRASCQAFSVYLFDWVQAALHAAAAIWIVSLCLGKNEALRSASCSSVLWLFARLETLWIDQAVGGSLCHISAVAAHWWCHKPAPAPLHHGWHFHSWRVLEWAKRLTSGKGFHYCSRNS